jgi:hypothetical protein
MIIIIIIYPNNNNNIQLHFYNKKNGELPVKFIYKSHSSFD